MGGGCELLSLLRRCTGGPVADDRRVDVVLDSGELVASYDCRAYTLLLKPQRGIHVHGARRAGSGDLGAPRA